MLTPKLVDYFKSKNWWFEEPSNEYRDALLSINVDIDSDFAQFYLHVEDCPTFLGRNREIYQIGWFLINSNSYPLSIERTHKALKMPEEYLPLDNFEGEYGYFYNQKTGEVIGLGLGKEIHDFMAGILKPQWPSFNDFLEFFFDI
ncbi:hypothetical protein ACRGNN_004173 [Providencia stuartii]|uniref:Uncharacterized protein n=1 Tax=Providencia stuartii ATCC 25827 TaxID=471874 RepID=A0AA87CQC8_PROST|nr:MULTISPECIES: hypothetical protein [Providencia]APG49479.1 hypothetical protein BGK56_00305 [Providencia stuartii]AVL40731.1 hypothetical protein CEP70_12345 [Providencia stuartii]EDU58802.1 hypothetical protein PROSTU_01983 [Providencia stuartii ATCC 25827]EMD1719163.1 hypothetical protein [Providencia stuartii]MBG5910080.1 hypothetical protein [Providencia stuartii]